MKKIITNKDKLPPKLRNYVAKRKTWVDKDNRYEHYIYMDTVDKDEEQSYPEKTILRYNGSSDTKNIPNRPPKILRNEADCVKVYEDSKVLAFM